MPLTPLPADPLVQTAAALAGSDSALGHLLTLHEPVAYRVAFRLLGRESDAQDAVQDGFLNAVRAIRGGSGPPSEPDRFKAWLLRVVTNAALTRLRRRTKPGLRVSMGGVVDTVAMPELVGPAREAERRQVRGDVLRAVMALPASQRQALTLREYQGLSYEEIGHALGISRSAAALLLFRARQGFRAAYDGLAAAASPPGCTRLAPLLSQMLDDEVSMATWGALSAHLDVCAHCRTELTALRKTRQLPGLVPA